MAVKKGGLGRGLDSLFTENTAELSSATELKTTELEPNRDQPRRDFDEEAINSLSASIKEYGILQPIVVRMVNDRYQIVAGERRWRAAMQAGLATVPVVIKELDDMQVAELAVIENLQREDLNPIEEAQAFKRLAAVFGLSQEQIAEKVGRSRPAVANSLRLLELDSASLDLVRKGEISASAARTLLSAKDNATLKLMREAAKNGASIRELEKMAKGVAEIKKDKPGSAIPPYFKEVELALTDELHRKVKVQGTADKGGTLSIEFYSKEDLYDFLKRFN